jgi:hypothetical protein
MAGSFIPGRFGPRRDVLTRVAVFIDYQNVYMGARKAFDLRGHGHLDGQVLPRRLGVLLADRGRHIDASRTLVSVSVFRGEPSPRHSPKGQAACQRQVHRWSHQSGVRAVTRPLKYYARDLGDGRTIFQAREKGIDVLIALAMVTGALKGEYDIGILCSVDSDLGPAVEQVRDAGRICEVAAWRSPNGGSPRLRVHGRNPWCHWLDEHDYARVHDDTDYLTR